MLETLFVNVGTVFYWKCDPRDLHSLKGIYS